MNHRNMIHLNGNLLCAIDTETTGLTAGYHDLIEIAIIPLNSELEPVPDIIPFNLMLKPKRPENADPEAVNKQGRTLADIILRGMEPWRAVDLFDEWFQRLGLAPGKKISPLAHNWPFDRSFIQDWLDKATFEQFIDGRFRDSMAAGLFLNDLADLHQEPYPFHKLTLGSLAAKFSLPFEKAHTALEDALMCAQIYKRMLYSAR